MRKSVVEMYTSSDGQIKFVRAKGGGWIVLVDADAVTVTTDSLLGSSTKTKLSAMPGLNTQVMSAFAELADFVGTK